MEKQHANSDTDPCIHREDANPILTYNFGNATDSHRQDTHVSLHLESGIGAEATPVTGNKRTKKDHNKKQHMRNLFSTTEWAEQMTQSPDGRVSRWRHGREAMNSKKRGTPKDNTNNTNQMQHLHAAEGATHTGGGGDCKGARQKREKGLTGVGVGEGQGVGTTAFVGVSGEEQGE